LNRLRTALLTAGIVLCLMPRAEAKWVWHKEKGWIEINAFPRNTEQQRYDYAIALMTDEKYESALVEFKRLIREFAGTETAARCAAHRVECYCRIGAEWKAYRRAEGFFSSYPQSDMGNEVLKWEFRAGTQLLEEGEKSGITVLEAVLGHQPDGPLAEQCYYEMGRYHQREKRYDRAEQCYGTLVERFLDGRFAPKALLAASICALRRSKKDKHGRAAAVGEAKSNLQHYSEKYAKGPEAEDAAEYIAIAQGLETAKGKYTPRFYYALLDYMEKRYEKALKTFSKVARKKRKEDIGGDARYYEAQCLRHLDKPYKAFKALEKFFEKHPGHVKQTDAAKAEYALCAVLKKEDLKIAAWAYGQVVKRSPYSSFADDAQMEEGNCLYALRKYTRAQTSYEALLKAYPDSEWYGAAIFQIGMCSLESSKFANEPGSLLKAAQARFEDYITRYPTGVKVADARAGLKRVREYQAENAFEIAEFYVRIKRPAAAMVYLEHIKRDFGDTEWAARAEERSREIRGKGGKG